MFSRVCRSSGGAQLRKSALQISQNGRSNHVIISRAAYSTGMTIRANQIVAPLLRQFENTGRRQLTPLLFESNTFKRFYADFPKHVKIPMPALSPTMNSGNIGKWAKKVGDQVVPGDVLVEIETDKATMDFECQEEGYLAKILMPTGTKDVPINTLIAVLSEKKEDVSKFDNYAPIKDSAPAAATSATSKKEINTQETQPQQEILKKETTSAPISTASDRQFVSPAARKLASEKNVPLNQIKGSGPNGRVVLSDIERFLSSGEISKYGTTPAPASTPATAVAPKQASAPDAGYIDIPLNNIRRVIASRLTSSKQTVPHYYLTVEINVDKLLKLRSEFNKKNENGKLSVNDFIIKAAAKALLKVPEVNSSWQNDFIRQYQNADISVAVATPNGLITPIVFNAQNKGLSEISNNVKELSARAKEGKLKPQEFQGGTFSISNLGMFGIKSFTAIINPPQSCILAVGTTTKTVVPIENPEKGVEAYKTVNVMHVTMSCDHRVVDGAVGAQWLQVFKGYMEDPVTMLL